MACTSRSTISAPAIRRLIYLRRFAFDKIKIDRSFLESMEATGESAILVHSIVHLGRALGLTRHGGGRRDQGAAPLPAGARLPPAAGLPVLEAGAAGGDRPAARHRRAGRQPKARGREPSRSEQRVEARDDRVDEAEAQRAGRSAPTARPAMTTNAVALDEPETDEADREPERDLPDEGRREQQAEREREQQDAAPGACASGLLEAPPCRGRDQRSSRRRTGMRAIDRPRHVLAARCDAGEERLRQPGRRRVRRRSARRREPSSRPQTSGIGGGIGRQFGRPSITTSSAKARSRRTATMSATVKRSLGWSASRAKTSEVRALEGTRAQAGHEEGWRAPSSREPPQRQAAPCARGRRRSQPLSAASARRRPSGTRPA